jgi:hypothetical protein
MFAELERYLNEVLEPAPHSFIILAVISLLIYRLPYINKGLRVFHTLIHETGHSIAAFLTSGSTLRIELNHDLSGITITKSKNAFQQCIISLFGYPFASFFAFMSYYAVLNGYEKFVLWSLLLIIFFQLLINVRNSFGIFWSIISIALVFWITWWQTPYHFISSVIITNIILSESIIMAGIVFYQSIAKPSSAGDATNLYNITKLPQFFWGLLFFLQSLYFLWLVIQIYAELYY